MGGGLSVTLDFGGRRPPRALLRVLRIQQQALQQALQQKTSAMSLRLHLSQDPSSYFHRSIPINGTTAMFKRGMIEATNNKKYRRDHATRQRT